MVQWGQKWPNRIKQGKTGYKRTNRAKQDFKGPNEPNGQIGAKRVQSGLNRAENGQRVQRDQKVSNRTKQVQTRLKSTKQGQIGLSGTKWGRPRPDGAKQGQKGQNRV